MSEETGSGPYMPRSPDPTTASAAAVATATDMFRREIQQLRELHDKDTAALRGYTDDVVRRFTEAIDQLRDEIDRRDTANRELVEQRLAAMDERHHAQDDVAVRIRLEIDEEVRHLREIINERFTSIGQQLTDRDMRLTEASGAADKALTAALNAARELVESRAAATADAAAKYEIQIAAQIGQLAALAAASRDGLDAKIGALKERIDRGEGSTSGEQHRRSEQRLDLGQVVAVVAVIVAILSVVLYALKK